PKYAFLRSAGAVAEDGDRRGPVVHVEQVEDVFEVLSHGGLRDLEPVADLGIGQAVGGVAEHLALTPAEQLAAHVSLGKQQYEAIRHARAAKGQAEVPRRGDDCVQAVEQSLQRLGETVGTAEVPLQQPPRLRRRKLDRAAERCDDDLASPWRLLAL